MREIYAPHTNFPRGRVWKPGDLTHRKFGTTSPQFSRKSDPNVFVSIKNRLELWQIILHLVYCRLERLAAAIL